MSDLIDRQAVIDLLKQMRKDGNMVPWEGKDVFARIRKLPTIQPEKAQLSQEDTTSDLIDRKAALDALRRCQTYLYDARDPELKLELSSAEAAINNLPTIQPVATDTNVGNNSVIPNSSDAISRQAAIDAIDKQIKQCCKALGSLSLSDVDKHAVEVEMASFSAYREMLENLPTAQSELQWIPVERELPEPRIDVWVNSDLGQMVGYYDEMVELWYGRDYLELIVNAWMPLPEPYTK